MRELRRFPRVPYAVDAKYHRAGVGESWRAVRVVNLSAGGIRVLTEELLNLGEILELRIQLTGVRGPLVLHGRVAWRQMQAAGVTEHGLGFIDVTPSQQEQIDGLVCFLKQSA